MASLRSGWPQLDDDEGYAWGVYNANASMGNIDSDSQGELIRPLGRALHLRLQTQTAARWRPTPVMAVKAGGLVGIWEDPAIELRGLGGLATGCAAKATAPTLAEGASVIADVNNDGTNEVIATGQRLRLRRRLPAIALHGRVHLQRRPQPFQKRRLRLDDRTGGTPARR